MQHASISPFSIWWRWSSIAAVAFPVRISSPLPSIAWRPILCSRHQLEVARVEPACTIVVLLWWPPTIDFLAIASLQEVLRETVAVMSTCFDIVDWSDTVVISLDDFIVSGPDCSANTIAVFVYLQIYLCKRIYSNKVIVHLRDDLPSRPLYAAHIQRARYLHEPDVTPRIVAC